mmetsp:Transcript_47945/g.104525  ORF Transcript_47945/g.104525 Transcript_47945/m.104525 type:complete len:131 (-) Transcript_47945:671-1063(-)
MTAPSVCTDFSCPWWPWVCFQPEYQSSGVCTGINLPDVGQDTEPSWIPGCDSKSGPMPSGNMPCDFWPLECDRSVENNSCPLFPQSECPEFICGNADNGDGGNGGGDGNNEYTCVVGAVWDAMSNPPLWT